MTLLPAAAFDLFAVIKVALGFGFVIFVHELGHFLFAKLNGVRVERFAIGFDFFGARLGRFVWGDTEYVIGAFPLGGYVKMLGQNDLPEDRERGALQPDSFGAKPVFARIQIISAGVRFNFLSAFVLAFGALVVGYHHYPSVVGAVGFSALEDGLRPGDTIVSIEGTSVGSWEDLVATYATFEPGSKVELGVDRAGQPLTIALTVQRDAADPFNMPDFGRPLVPRVSHVVVDSAADEAGVKPGDRLLAVDEHEIHSWSGFSALIRRRADIDTTLLVERQDKDGAWQRQALQARPRSRRPDMIPSRVLGVEPQQPPVIDLVVPGSTAEAAGLLVGDRVLAVGEQGVDTWYALWREVTWTWPEDEPVELRVRRAEQELAFRVPQREAADWALGASGLVSLGLAGRPPEQLVLGAAAPGSAAQRAGLQAGDRVRSFTAPIDGSSGPEDWTVDEPTWETLLYALNSLREDRITLGIERGDARLDVQIEPDQAPPGFEVGFLGVGPMAREDVRQLGLVEAVGPALRAPLWMLQNQLRGLSAMLQQRISPRLVAGPVGILQATYTYASRRAGDLLNFLALLSVNLAVVNFLPIPITDGGHFLFLMYESVKGRPMDEEMEARFQWAGLVMIVMLLVFATFNDFGRLLGF